MCHRSYVLLYFFPSAVPDSSHRHVLFSHFIKLFKKCTHRLLALFRGPHSSVYFQNEAHFFPPRVRGWPNSWKRTTKENSSKEILALAVHANVRAAESRGDYLIPAQRRGLCSTGRSAETLQENKNHSGRQRASAVGACTAWNEHLAVTFMCCCQGEQVHIATDISSPFQTDETINLETIHKIKMQTPVRSCLRATLFPPHFRGPTVTTTASRWV